MNIHSDIPLSLHDLNVDWLTKVLRHEGVLQHEKVVSFKQQVIGEGVGFLGEVAIIDLKLSPDNTDAPTSMILKIPAANRNRTVGQVMGVYEREVRFYGSLGKTLGVRTPKSYYAAMDVAGDPLKTLKGIEMMNHLPVWLMWFVFLLVNWLTGFVSRRYVLLIENLGKFRMGNQIEGCSLADARLALSGMAKMHAQYWDSQELDSLQWIVPLDLTAKITQATYLKAVDKFIEGNKDWLSDHQIKILSWLKQNGVELILKMCESPVTLLHGDFRLDNLCFDDENQEVVLFDWQTLLRGPAGLELAYFLSASLKTDVDDEQIDDLLEFYRLALADSGVDISEQDLRWDYEAGMLLMLQRVTPALYQDVLDLGEDRGLDLMVTWVERALKKLEHVNVDDLLDRATGQSLDKIPA